MPRDVHIDNLTEARKPDADPFIFLFEVNVGAGEVFRVTDYRETVIWDSRTWYPYPISQPTVPDDSDTAAKTFDISVLNINQELTDRLKDEKLQGQELTIYKVHSQNLSLTDPLASHVAKILAATVDRARGSVTFRLGSLNWLEVNIGRRYQRHRCWWKIGSPMCGYDITRSGAITTCDNTLDGANGCVVHGDDEEDAGIYRAHPRFFGAFPGINKVNRG